MKAKIYVTAILPSITVSLCLLILPLVLGLYFWFTQYSNNVFLDSGIGYFDIQQNIVFRFFFGLPWSEWLARSGDFLFWGIIATVGLVIAWLISSARTSVSNHLAEEKFTHFKGSKESWHGHFLVALAIKIALGVIILYLLALLLTQAIPNLAIHITAAIKNPELEPISAVFKQLFVLFALQYLVVVCVKIIKHIEVD